MTAWRSGAASLLTAVAVLGCVWFLWGLRFTNHDDLAFEIVALNPGIPWWGFADFVAQAHGRFVAYMNMPLVLLGSWLAAGPGGELVVSGHVAVLGLLIFILLRRLAGPAFAAFATFTIFAGFAFHYFFTSPPGYPLMGLMAATLFLLAAIALDRAIAARRPWPVAAMALSTLSLVGHEFNVLLFTLPLLALVWFREPLPRRRWMVSLAFLLCWAAFAVAFVAFRLTADVDAQGERTALVFRPAAMLVTFGLLVGRAILPSGLALTIDLTQPPIAGMPALPRLLDSGWMLGTLGSDPAGHLAVLAVFLLAFWFLLPRRTLGWRGSLPLAGMAVLLIVVPCGILSLSPTYQHIIRAGHTQGHNASAFAQVGVLLLLAVLATEASARLSGRWRPVLALPLAALATVTLAYNLATRDAMSANRQKWSAFALLAEAEPDATIRAPDFWLVSAVSAMPEPFFDAPAYWTAYARYALGHRTELRPPGAPTEDGETTASYTVSPNGRPFAILHKPGRSVVLAAAPAPFRVTRPSGHQDFGGDGWACERVCRLELVGEDRIDPATDRVLPLAPGASGVLARLALPRHGAFGAR